MSSTETHLKQNYIGGRWVDSKGGKLHDVINPATEEAASTVVLGTAADVDDAVAAAKTAFKSFSQTTREERLEDQQSVGAGKSEYVRVDPGGRRSLKKKKYHTKK